MCLSDTITTVRDRAQTQYAAVNNGAAATRNPGKRVTRKRVRACEKIV